MTPALKLFASNSTSPSVAAGISTYSQTPILLIGFSLNFEVWFLNVPPSTAQTASTGWPTVAAVVCSASVATGRPVSTIISCKRGSHPSVR